MNTTNIFNALIMSILIWGGTVACSPPIEIDKTQEENIEPSVVLSPTQEVMNTKTPMRVLTATQVPTNVPTPLVCAEKQIVYVLSDGLYWNCFDDSSSLFEVRIPVDKWGTFAVASHDSLIAFTFRDSIQIFNLLGELKKEIDDLSNDSYPAYPAWSPDGNFIAYTAIPENIVSQGRLMIVHVETGVISSVYETEFGDGFPFASWSPDGSKIVLFNDMAQDVLLVDVSCDDNPPLCSLDNIRKITPANQFVFERVSWSPDSKNLVTICGVGDQTGKFEFSVCLLDLNGNIINEFNMANLDIEYRPGAPVWSPDGQEIAFAEGNVFLLSISDGSITKIPSGSTKDKESPNWITIQNEY